MSELIRGYEVVIGLEIHAELKTKTKIFCSCKNEFGGKPNENTCEKCIGYPGALPVLNKHAIELAIKAGLAVGSEINKETFFERKNYFYPDLSKAYQISQLEKPLCVGGGITLKSGKFIRLNRIHVEEDAGKLIHQGEISMIDYNRAGVPLIESVTEPDIRTKEEAIEFFTTLRNIFVYAGVADCKMEQGGLRCDVNLSVHKIGTPFGTRTEMKNLNSFKSVERAIEYETNRQIDALESGEKIVQETRKWDDVKGKTFAMRSKEEAQDYRYFKDPDLVTLVIDNETIEKLKAEAGETPQQKKERYVSKLKLPEYDADVILADSRISKFFDEALQYYNNAKTLSNITMGEILSRAKNFGGEILINAKNLADILKLQDDGKINQAGMRKLIDENFKEGNPEGNMFDEAKKFNLISESDEAALTALAEEIVKNNPAALADYKNGNTKTMAFFIGQAMKQTQGKANPAVMTKIFEKTLAK